MTASLLIEDVLPPVLRLTLNDPTSRNSLSEAMMASISEALDRAAGDDNIRVVIFAAIGPAFSSGHNLKEMTERRKDADGGVGYFKDLMARCSALMQAVAGHPKPVIAEVQGIASAAGCQLVASCDLAIASETASFNTAGVNIGLFCSTPMVALSRNIAPKQAMEMLLTGNTISAHEANRIGLVNRVVTPNQLADETDRLARLIASKPPAVIQLGKQAFHRQLVMPVAEAYAFTSQVMAENLMLAETREGIGTFLEKRPPNWKD
jgi:enoyl-CoA hydratase/carnithine racemase